ncbi:MAG: sigma-70 family RNA polymerase sigma factor [Planctomycetaceae bacterium]
MSSDSRTEFHAAFQAIIAVLNSDTNDALGRLFDLTASRLVRLALTVTGSQPDAEDAVQGAFSRIARKPKLLAKADTPWPYLIRTVRNESLRIVQKRRHVRMGDLDTAGSQQTPESVFHQEETAERVRRILATLPKPQYDVVILKHWEDLTFAEIADVLGKSQNTVASRYRYAMEKLQRSLEPLVNDRQADLPTRPILPEKTPAS